MVSLQSIAGSNSLENVQTRDPFSVEIYVERIKIKYRT